MHILNAEVSGERREAAFSPDRQFRYRLDITWDSTRPTMTTICLNPSTADHLQDDPTIRRGKAFARSFGCGTYRMLNVFAFRSTDYTAIFRQPDPIGEDNTLEYLRFWCDGTLAVAAWGAHITERNWWRHYYRGHDVADAIPELMCLKRTKSGHPQHPLYLPAGLRPMPFSYKSVGVTPPSHKE